MRRITPQDVSIRVITDHIRSATFMISDGIMPSNERKRLCAAPASPPRRPVMAVSSASRANSLWSWRQTVIDGSKDGYPELDEKKDFIFKVITQEEEQFQQDHRPGTFTSWRDWQAQMEASGSTVLSGEEAFRLYDTYGFPVDLTREILEEKGFSIRRRGIRSNGSEQRQKERAKEA